MKSRYDEIKFHLNLAHELTKTFIPEKCNNRFYRYREHVLRFISESSQWLDDAYYDGEIDYEEKTL